MTYLILESRAAYCVALGEDGRCVKCANMRYEVGDRVENIVELKMPERRDSRRVIRMASLCAGLAACVCIAFFGWYQPNYAAYGSLRMSINPDVELTLSRTERVLDAEGLNPDGAALLEGFDFSGMDAAEAAGALVAKSISDGYLSEGGQVTVSVDGGSDGWRHEAEDETLTALEERYGTFARICTPDDPVVTIPVATPSPTPTPTPTPTPAPTPVPTPMPSPPPYTDDDDDDDDDDWDDDWDDDGDQDDDNDDWDD